MKNMVEEPDQNEKISDDRDIKVSRRNFLGMIWVGLSGIAALEIGGMVLAYMRPRLARGDFGSMITVGPIDDFPPGSVTPVTNGKFYLSRLKDSGFLAIYKKCTHLGCSVPFVQTEGKFVCPCHNSQFDDTGELLNPPAPRPLDLFPVLIEDGIVKVDTGKIISRNHFDPSQVVYA
jgi:cytochrome b6-f complex iron-sulfur subunit